jgi:hypothetical protein
LMGIFPRKWPSNKFTFMKPSWPIWAFPETLWSNGVISDEKNQMKMFITGTPILKISYCLFIKKIKLIISDL